MDLLKKIDLVLQDEIDSGATTSGNVAINTAKGKIDVIGGECPKDQVYDKIKKVCVPNGGLKEDARNPKAGDRFSYKSKKLTIKSVGSGIGHDKYIDVQFDNEKHPRSINMKNFFKGDDFKFLKESSVSGMVAGSGQTRVWGSNVATLMPDLNRKNPPEDKMEDKTKENLSRKSLRFNKLTGAYVPDLWGDDE